MSFEITKYPLAWRAIEEMKASYADDEEAAEGLETGVALTLRTFEIIETYAGGTAREKEDLMAVAAILRRKGTVFGMDTSDIAENYNPHVLALVIEIQQGLNESKGGGATKDILEVATATQIATHEMMIAWASSEAAQQWRAPLERYRAHRDRSAYADLAETPLQKQEMKIYNDLMATLDELAGTPSSGAPKPSTGTEPKSLH